MNIVCAFNLGFLLHLLMNKQLEEAGMIEIWMVYPKTKHRTSIQVLIAQKTFPRCYLIIQPALFVPLLLVTFCFF